MSRPTVVVLEHEQPAMTGVLTFDGETFERFGFNTIHSARVPVYLMKSVEVSFESGLLKTPYFRIEGVGGVGVTLGLDPKESDKPALESLAGEIDAAISKGGWPT
ncbi:MAG: hypothetical protein M3Y34_02755 [Actinomycetota bacterium]|nr:hypothetical protein [Actinomycetota bacterium]